MAAPLGFKTFTVGEVLSAADVNGYLMQGVLVFATTAARDAAITSPQEGQFAFTKDTNSLFYYDGAAWVASGATGDIEGVTAGVGISGGGTSGTVTVTNSMATAIDAKGDLVVGTGADTFSRLAVGTNTYTLVADSAEATGLKWAAPASGGSMTLLQSGNLSGSVVTLSTISADYIHLYLQINDFYPSSNSGMLLRPNDLTSGYLNLGDGNSAGTTFIGTASTTNSHWEDNVKNADNNNAISFFIYDYTNTIATKTAQVYSKFTNDGNNTRISQLISLIPTTSAISSFTITTVSGTFSGGSYKLYGVK